LVMRLSCCSAACWKLLASFSLTAARAAFNSSAARGCQRWLRVTSGGCGWACLSCMRISVFQQRTRAEVSRRVNHSQR
jgi:hypothetical protein